MTRPLAILSTLTLAFLAGCSADPPTKMRVPTEVTKLPAKELQAKTATDAAIAGGIAVGMAEPAFPDAPPEPKLPAPPEAPTPPTPPAPPEVTAAVLAPPPASRRVVVNGREVTVMNAAPAPPKPAAVKLTKVRSDKPHKTREQAVSDALVVAQLELMKQLQAQDPPVTAKPSLSQIRAEFLKKDSVTDVKPTDADKAEFKRMGLGENLMWVEIDVELSEGQVRGLRAGERVDFGVRVAAALFAVFLAVFGFFRLDALTKGYLTPYLVIGAVGVVLAAGAAVVFAMRSGTAPW